VDCISKGKARVRYEFGTKVSVATTHKEGFVVGMRAMPGNPYDGHTLREALEQVEILTGTRTRSAFVDRGYRGHGVETTEVFISGQRRGMTPALRRDLRRRSAIEPAIGHMKTDGRLARCALKGHARRCPPRRPLRLRAQHPHDPGPSAGSCGRDPRRAHGSDRQLQRGGAAELHHDRRGGVMFSGDLNLKKVPLPPCLFVEDNDLSVGPGSGPPLRIPGNRHVVQV
jgi:hypothetical protein